ncbi:2'-5' RNA ligase family protein [Candidatus Kaiserbacteria bacterium]|nr:2'-5' RNA ligase family protein [Candidatus Kaiserbacteria bacterium]
MTHKQDKDYYLALDPGPEVNAYVDRIASRLEDECSIPLILKRSPPHLPLVQPFNSIDTRRLLHLISKVSRSCRETEPFELTFSGFGWFSENPESQILYLPALAHTRLEAFARELTALAEEETRKPILMPTVYIPYIGIARYLTSRQTARAGELFESDEGAPLLTTVADQVILYRHTTPLDGRPPFYREDEHFTLTGTQN